MFITVLLSVWLYLLGHLIPFMPKLQFKRTPEEEAARQRKKQKKEERRKRRRGNEEEPESSTRKHRRTETKEDEFWAEWANEQLFGDPSGSHLDDLLSQVEEELFREKMFEELEAEERLDSIEARLNDHAHIPNRWKRGIFTFEEPFGMTDCTCGDPLLMDDEEYAEWIRTGMHRLKHAEEYAEQQRKKALYETRKAEKRAQKEEAARLERAAEEERKLKKEARERRRWIHAKDSYDQQWKELLSGKSHDQLKFCDIPWPVVNAYTSEEKPATTPQAISVCLEDLTEDAISKFLFPVSSEQESVADMKLKREKLREALRRFHPDKFEGRLMKVVKESERARVREGIAAVIRVLNRLTEKGQ